MVAVLGVLLVGTMLATAAFQAVGGDLPFARASQDRKQAYQAAQAGIDWYKSYLAQDPDFWTKCVPTGSEMANAPVWLGGGTRVWRNATGGSTGYTWSGTGPRSWHTLSGGTAPKFSVTLVSTTTDDATCRANPEASLLSSEGTFTIRSTGIVPDPGDVTARDETRTIVTTFRRKSFLDYLYFTDLETSDPLTYTSSTDRTNAAKYCTQPRAARNAVRSTFDCSEISFGDNDVINGPFHTNDDILVCGNPTFGRDQSDNVEISGPATNGWTSSCSGSSPNFKGTKKLGADPLTPPTNSNSIAARAQQGGTYLTGTNTIVLNGDTMTVNGVSRALPANGVIYDAAKTGCGGIASPANQTYNDSSNCAVLYVRGNTNRSLTIDSEADVVVNGNVTHAPGYVLGLIAGNFVRVMHKVNRSSGCANSGTQGIDYFTNIEIDAAILALNHSFIVDNWDCGKLGTLTVKGAIAQEFRGPVGTYNTSTGSSVSGYIKNYSYDDKLKYRSPPYFLPPVDAAWRVISSNEQEKSAGGT
jgi:Tfp pilus assembly protein PilX